MHRRVLFFLVLAFSLVATAAAEVPPFLRTAIAQFNPDPPAGWAYTLTTARGDDTSSERFDPSRPKGGEWTLLATAGRAPTEKEIERYLRYKASNTPATSRASFARGDLDLEGAQLLSEDADRAEFRIRFRDSVNQPLLAHVVLDLTVRKSSAQVERSVLRLFEPFSPALGVRMRELTVTTLHEGAEGNLPARPREVVSRFRGRMFFVIPLEEDLRVAYSDFVRVR
jgi:hypothetical protein